MTIRYNHAYDFAFEVVGSKCPQGSDVTEEMLMGTLQARLERVSADGSWKEAFGAPYSTYEYILEERLHADSFLTAAALEEIYGDSGKGEYPNAELGRSAWRKAVASETTDSGYWEWVYNKLNDMA